MNDALFVNSFFAKTDAMDAAASCVVAADPKVPPWKLELINRRRTRNTNNNQLTKCGGGGGNDQQQKHVQVKPVQWTWSPPSTQHFLQQQPTAQTTTSPPPPPPQHQQQQQPLSPPPPPPQSTVVVGTTTVRSAGMRLFKCEATIMTNFKKNSVPVANGGVARCRSKFKTKPQIITEITNGLDYRSDSSGEEFKYGPGIVNKLKSKYMSMTVREQRPRPALRRSTSMDNIVDDGGGGGNGKRVTSGADDVHQHQHQQQQLMGGCKRYAQPDVIICGAAAVAAAAAKNSSDKMKRARSMETLSCGTTTTTTTTSTTVVDDDQHPAANVGELPPPDVVKTYKKIFETKTLDDGVKSPVKPKPAILPKPTALANPVEKTRPPRMNKAPLKKATPPIKYPNRLKKKEPLGFDRSKSLINDEVSSSQDESSMSSDDGGSARHKVAIKTAITTTTIDSKPISVQSIVQTKQICVIRPTTRITLQPEETTNAQLLSDKEIEKNFIINNSNNTNNTSVNNVNNTSVNNINNSNNININDVNNTSINNTNNVDSNTNGEKRIGGLWDKKRWDNHENSVVFNFVNRKGVPNYIDSEGPLQRRENSCGIKDGCIMLDVPCEESSTDDIDTVNSENFVIFVGDNIIIGRSNLRKENSSTQRKDLRIKFSEVLETMFEYPSEASLLIEDELTKHGGGGDDGDDDSTPAPPKSKFGNYVPSKLGTNEEAFLGEYGVSKSSNAKTTKSIDKHKEDAAADLMMDTNVPWSEETTPDLLF